MLSSTEAADALQEVDLPRLGRRIKNARLAAGLRQQDVVLEDWSAAYISRIEGGQRRPSFTVLTTIAERIGVPVAALLEGDITPNTWIVRETVEIVREWRVEAKTAIDAIMGRKGMTPLREHEGASGIQATRASDHD